MKLKTLITAIACMLLINLASAALTVQSFNCGQSNAQLSVPLTCTAVIANDDPNAQATLNSVTLSSTNGWTDRTSYAGSFVGNSIIGGGTASVTFSNIVPTSAGSGQTFSDILINDAGGNVLAVSNAPLNVVAVTSLTVSAPSNASTGSNFLVQANADISGQADLTFSISLSPCTLASGQVSSLNVGSVENTAQSVTWSVRQGYSTCSVTVTASAAATPVTVTRTASASITGGDPEPSSSGSSGGAGGGGGGTGGSNSSNISNTLPPAKDLQNEQRLKVEPSAPADSTESDTLNSTEDFIKSVSEFPVRYGAYLVVALIAIVIIYKLMLSKPKK